MTITALIRWRSYQAPLFFSHQKPFQCVSSYRTGCFTSGFSKASRILVSRHLPLVKLADLKELGAPSSLLPY